MGAMVYDVRGITEEIKDLTVSPLVVIKAVIVMGTEVGTW